MDIGQATQPSQPVPATPLAVKWEGGNKNEEPIIVMILAIETGPVPNVIL